MKISHIIPTAMAMILCTGISSANQVRGREASPLARSHLEQLDLRKGICAVVGLPAVNGPDYVVDLARGSELTIYLQANDPAEVTGVRSAADNIGLLGRRIFVENGDMKKIHLASNLADAVLVAPSAIEAIDEKELLRVVRPGGTVFLGERRITKPPLKGAEGWTHPYHGPDNNPQSTDQVARAPYLTQFVAEPKFSPMPQVSVGAGGRIFKAFGHIAHKANQNDVLNTLVCVNAYNGTILWKRPLRKGFMIHRNTMIATPDALYMGDDESCKVIDAETGETRGEIMVPKGVGDGPVWKWMAMKDGVLYALTGATETKVETVRSRRRGLGHWPWGMWQGHDYKNPQKSFGFGRTFIAIDIRTGKMKWNHTEREFIDSRGVCMRNGKIFYLCPQKFLAGLNTTTGKPAWNNSSKDLMEAIGTNGRAQHYVTGYATTTYIKCNDDYIFFAGPQRPRLVCASTSDGRLLWQKTKGNLQLVLREDGLYTAGPSSTGAKLDYATGKELSKMPTRRACTRATGSIDSIFYRTSGGTVRLELPSNTTQHIAPMRPPCQDGVIISDGHLFWGPWMCGCQLSLYGHISLSSSNGQLPLPGKEAPPLKPGDGNPHKVAPLEIHPGDWAIYQGNNQRVPSTDVPIPGKVTKQWSFQTASKAMPTAPVVAGGLVFVGDRAGVLRAIDDKGREKWKSYVGGAIYFPPVISNSRAYVGSADGRIHAFEAATGRRLWSFRVAPGQRRIRMFEKLISTWPVAGGVIVEKGTVYAAAGIAHYDGTHVVAIDAVTGKLKWRNDSSGNLSEKVKSGISMQGDLYLQDGELCFLGGGVYETARFNLDSGQCMNTPDENPRSKFRTAFYPYYPGYGNYLSLDHNLPDGRSLIFDASYEGNRFTSLALLSPLPPGTQKVGKDAARWAARRGWSEKRKPIWQDNQGRRFASFILNPDILVAAGDMGNEDKVPFLAAIHVGNGKVKWNQTLPAQPIKGGAAIDHKGRILLTLENGETLCYAAP